MEEPTGEKRMVRGPCKEIHLQGGGQSPSEHLADLVPASHPSTWRLKWKDCEFEANPVCVVSMPSWPVARGSEVQPARDQADGPIPAYRGDWLLSFVYRTSSVQLRVAGLQPVLLQDRRMENVDLSSVVSIDLSHWPVCEGRRVSPALGDSTCTYLPLASWAHPSLSPGAVILKLPPGRNCSIPFTDEEIKA